MIPTETLSKYEINAILNYHSKSPHPEEMAIEVKVVAMVFQRAPNNVSPFEIVTCRLKGNNEKCSFKNDMREVSCEA